ncbi:hypothetical protein CcrKarma_gp267 [Caulobacter virus Karma]|uniref:hypothetical protein n=1 Tax=Caulobacter virus Magneto TaxID=1211642 RepID=UPI00028B19E4|nr:hypothetical protein CcrMagneto_gp261 [Caulobacter virus Magneto]YP_006989647.1 hypothetical protein CcrKarma_gp267 [Caulobacter virus Karma]AFU87431.1 hypothetical protein CcrMagneto_gp261 [Caulobacter virus Magneto]AFU87784.1 hypothetical protein CcrKarma_gp267 [Caulobacter virus Karma]
MGLRKIPPRSSWWMGYALSTAFKKPSHEERIARLRAVQGHRLSGAQMRDPLMKKLVREGLVRLHRSSNAEHYKSARGGFMKSTEAYLTPAGEAYLADPTPHHVPKSERTEKTKGVRGK